MKTCSKCKEAKNKEDFGNDKSKKDGLQSYCKKCKYLQYKFRKEEPFKKFLGNVEYSNIKHIVSFSGGIGSFAAAKYIIDEYGIENVILLFADTLIEDEDLYRFLDDSEEYFKCKILRLKEGRDPWQVFFDEKFLGNWYADPCSKILKRKVLKDFIFKNFIPNEVTLYFGIDWMEAHRTKKLEENLKPFSCKFPLIENKYDKNIFMENMEIKPPRLYSMGFPHNNCGGFCVKAGAATFLNLLKNFPERYKAHEEKEEEFRKKFGKDCSILHDGVDKKKRLTLKELRVKNKEYLETESGQLDWGGCGCFSD